MENLFLRFPEAEALLREASKLPLSLQQFLRKPAGRHELAVDGCFVMCQARMARLSYEETTPDKLQNESQRCLSTSTLLVYLVLNIEHHWTFDRHPIFVC